MKNMTKRQAEEVARNLGVTAVKINGEWDVE